jgi:hypothetical protein
MKKFLILFLMSFSAYADNISLYSSNLNIIGVTPTSYNSPYSEGASNAFDGNPYTKYLNFDKLNAGVTVELNQGRVVKSFTITTANDFSGRDPTSYKLYGSNSGSSWSLIQQGSLTLSDSRYNTSTPINVNNTAAYVYYFMVFPTTKAGQLCGLNCDSMQIGELTYQYDPLNTTTSTKQTGGTIANPGTAGSTETAPPPPAPSYSATITAEQQAKVNAARARQTYKNEVNIDQIGNYNSIDVIQSGFYHLVDVTVAGDSNILDIGQYGIKNYANVQIQGSGNSLNSQQGNTGVGVGHFSEMLISGNNNTIVNNQSGNGEKISFISNNGNANAISSTQSGSGTKYSDIKATGNGHTVMLDQKDGGAHGARIEVTNNGGSSNINVLQQGNANQTYSIQQSCATVGGCSVTVTQQ